MNNRDRSNKIMNKSEKIKRINIYVRFLMLSNNV